MEFEDSAYFSDGCFYYSGVYSFYGGGWKRGFLVSFGSRYYRRIGDVRDRSVCFLAGADFKKTHKIVRSDKTIER